MTPEKIDQIEKDALWYCETYRTRFPEKAMATPKRHLLEKHLVAFARRWRTLGLFGEDAVESIHALVNRVMLRYRAVRGKENQFRSVLKALDHKGSAAVERESQQHEERRKRSYTDPAATAARKAAKQDAAAQRKARDDDEWRHDQHAATLLAMENLQAGIGGGAASSGGGAGPASAA